MGIQLHALVFSKQRHQQQPPAQRRSTDTRSSSSFASSGRQQQLLAAGATRAHGLPHRNRTSHDLRRPSQDSSNPWGSYSSRGGGSMLKSVSELGLTSSPTRGSTTLYRGSISKAKQVLAEAINSMPGTHGLSDFSPATCDTGVLSPLLSIIRQNGCVSRRSSFSEAASTCSSSCSTTSSGCGFTSGSAAGVISAVASRLARCSSSGQADEVSCSIPPTLHEDGPHLFDDESHAELLAAKQARQRTAHVQKVVDCIDTVKYLSMDDSNRMALIDLGAVELLLAKLQRAAKPAPEVSVAALGALSAICKYDALKQQLWDNPDSSVILQLLRSRRMSPEVKAAHMAAGQLAWSCDSSSGSNCASAMCGGSSSSVFDSVSSGPFSSADSSSSSCSGANVLLEPALTSALAEALHPAADVPVLLSALRLLSKAAASIDPELPAPPLSPSPAGIPSCSEQQQQQQRVGAGWHKVLFALMPLLIPTHRRQGHLVLGAALELLVVLTEQHQQLHAAVCISGCLPPLLAQVLEGTSEQSLQAACILTGIVDTTAAQERLCQEPALAALLRVLSDSGKSVDVRLAAVHMLRRLAAVVPRCVAVLKAQSAVPAVVALLREVHDSDVRHAAAGLLQLLGTPVVMRSRRSSDKGHGRNAQQCGTQQQHSSRSVLNIMAHAAPQQQQQQCYQQRQHAPMVAAGAAMGARAHY
jgi:hypothetical protein